MLGALSKRVPKRVSRTEAAKMKVKIEDRNKKVDELEKMFDCTYCGQPLEGKDRSSYMLLTRLGTESDNLGTMLEINSYNSLYEASKDTGISLNALWNVREKGNTLIVRRRDKAPFKIGWSNIHHNCFEARK